MRKMKRFEEISKESQNFFDYIVHFSMKKYTDEQEVVDDVLQTILKLEEELALQEAYFYNENLLISSDLIQQRMRVIKEITKKTT